MTLLVIALILVISLALMQGIVMGAMVVLEEMVHLLAMHMPTKVAPIRIRIRSLRRASRWARMAMWVLVIILIAILLHTVFIGDLR